MSRLVQKVLAKHVMLSMAITSAFHQQYCRIKSAFINSIEFPVFVRNTNFANLALFDLTCILYNFS